jgi:peptide/nickel transport system substrate-binding protein
MRSIPFKRVGVSITLLLVAMIAAACAGQTQPPPPATSAPAATNAPAPTTAPAATNAPAPTTAPAAGEKVLVYVTPTLALSLDPCVIPGQQTAEMIMNTSWYWTTYRQVDGPNGIKMDDTASGEDAIQPAAADSTTQQPGVLESWENSADGKVWTLHIRKGVKDTFGNELKADDAKWIWNRIKNFGPCTYIADALGISDVDKQVKVIDDYTVQITLEAPDPIFLRVLHVNNGMPFGPEGRKHTTADDPWAGAWMKENSASIGPYKVETWQPGVQMVLVKNPNWFGPKPDIDRIIYRQVPEDSNRLALLVNGDAQVARDLTQEELDQVAQTPGLHVQCIAANQFLYATMPYKSGPTSNIKVRQALAYAVPYDDILKSVYAGRAGPMPGMTPPNYTDFLGADKWPYKTDYDMAKKLLTDAGFANGFPLSVLVDTSVPEYERIAVLLKDSFSKIGVDLTIDLKPSAAYRDLEFSHQYNGMVFDQNYAITLDPDYHSNVWISPNPPPSFNAGEFTDEEFNKLQKQGFAMPAGPERTQVMHRIQEIFNEKLGYLSLGVPPTCYGLSDKVTGYHWHTHNQLIFSDLKLAQ